MLSTICIHVSISLLWLLLVGLLTSGNPIEDVSKLITQFSAVSAPASDYLLHLERIGMKTAKLIALAGPVSALVAEGLTMALGPQSEELQAIKNLHNFTETKFAEFTVRTEHLINGLSLERYMENFDNLVTIPLDQTEFYYLKVIDPARNRSHYRAQFVNRCSDRHSPIETLMVINRKVNLNCQRETDDLQKEAELFNALSNLFGQIEGNTSMSAFDSLILGMSYEEIKSRIHSMLGMLSEEQAMIHIRTLKKETRNTTLWRTQRALSDLHRALEASTTTTPFACLLRSALEDSEWKREALLDVAQYVELEMHRAVQMSTMCANITHGGKKEETEQAIRDTYELQETIASGMAEYIRNKLASTWPTISKKYALSTFDPNADFMTNAANIKRALDKRGPFNFYHNTFVYQPDLTPPEYFYALCEEHFCFQLLGPSTAHVAVVRYEQGQYYRFRDSTEWWSSVDVYQNITRAMNDFFEAGLRGPIPELLGYIGERVKDFNNRSLYGNLLVLHNMKYFEDDCVILAETSSGNLHRMESVVSMKYRYNPGLAEDCYCYRIFFAI